MIKNYLAPNQIFTVKNVLSSAECADFITLTENIGYKAASIYTFKGLEMRPDIRNNQRVIVDDRHLALLIWERISDSIQEKIDNRRAVGLNERFRFYRYALDQRFAPHTDGCYQRENGEQSCLTFMIYLNEGFKGGETRFYLPEKEGNLSVVPVTGMALCFVHKLRHEGAPVIQGCKYVLRSDVMYSSL